ncbi:complexin-3-like [Stegastes partitus]|uniref:Complexin-3-like n=1 Tax=Stegastes partitus TaxID=144197 RepID=A0A9Y4NBA6_9TELE|nr:PREDICTED: complexin-3-like [Stegastes partitus]
MESVVRVKKSLRTPIRKLSSCVSGVKDRRLTAKRRSSRCRRGAGGRAGCSRTRRAPPPRAQHPRDPPVLRSYRADLEKERQLREATNAQKNAERAAMRAHFRRKYQLSENQKDSGHLRSVGGKVSLPRDLSKMIHPDSRAKDDGFDLLGAFRGLGLGSALLNGKKPSRTPTPAAAGRSCKVM